MNDPLKELQRSLRLIAGLSAITTAGTGVWAFWPVSGALVRLPETTSTPDAAVKPQTTRIRPEVFAVNLWTPPVKPPPPPAPVAPSTPPPMKLQLLAILQTTHDSAGPFNAMIFDPDADRLVTLSVGDAIGPFTVRAVDARRVELARGEFTYTLTLASVGGGP